MAATGPIVVGYDDSEIALNALAWAAAEAERHQRPLRVISSVETYNGMPMVSMTGLGTEALAIPLEPDAGWADDFAASLRRDWPSLDITVERPLGAASKALLSVEDPALIVLGSTGKGLTRQLLLGSTSMRVVSVASCPVCVLGPAYENRPEVGVVAVGIDGSPDSVAAAAWALQEARVRGATLAAINTWAVEVVNGYVVTEPESPEWQAIEQRQRQVVEDALAAAGGTDGVTVQIRIERASPSRALVEAAAEADLLVVGSRGRGAIAGEFLGSVSQKVMRGATAPIVVVKD